MALVVKSTDELTTEQVDVYDSLIAPKKVWRNSNNKLYLIFRSIAAGFSHILDAALALRGKYDPMYCDDADLYSTAYLVGTHPKLGTGSIVNITIRNTDTETSKLFAGGTYKYVSVPGMVFSFSTEDYMFDPGEQKVISAISAEKGSFPVLDNARIALSRTDGASIDSVFTFSCANNLGQLGYTDETPFEFRQRILNDAERQDHLKELELKIRNLPNIFECNLVLNPDVVPIVYDGITLAPLELLVTITGVPSDALADAVTGSVLYATHRVDPALVVYNRNELFANGVHPVYFKYHDTADFSLSVTYQYDPLTLKPTQIEERINLLLDKFTHAVTHIDMVSEELIYGILVNLDLPNVLVLNVDILINGSETSYLKIPKTRLPHLTGITYIPTTEGA